MVQWSKNQEIVVKKTYEKPVVQKRDKLSGVTAGKNLGTGNLT